MEGLTAILGHGWNGFQLSAFSYQLSAWPLTADS
jgi:hypothetical protein